MATPSSDYGAGQAQTAQDTGNSAINNFNPQGFANQIRGASAPQGFSDLYNQQQNTSNAFVNQYKQAIANNPTATGLYNQANAQFNVEPLAQNAANLQNQQLMTPSQNLNMARGFNYDQNQVNNKTNQDLARLGPVAQAATNQSQMAQNLAGQFVQQGLSQNATNLLPTQFQGQQMTDLFARQQAGYSQANQQELDGLIAKMNSGVSLSQTEMARASALAQAETNYNTALIGQQNVTLSPGQQYLNTITGGRPITNNQ